MNPYLPPGFRADVATHVVAIAAPQHRGWKWRLVNAVGASLMESQGSFPTIADAVAEGQRRMPHRAPGGRKDGTGRSRSAGASK
jgi:hypothetical protein